MRKDTFFSRREAVVPLSWRCGAKQSLRCACVGSGTTVQRCMYEVHGWDLTRSHQEPRQTNMFVSYTLMRTDSSTKVVLTTASERPEEVVSRRLCNGCAVVREGHKPFVRSAYVCTSPERHHAPPQQTLQHNVCSKTTVFLLCFLCWPM